MPLLFGSSGFNEFGFKKKKRSVGGKRFVMKCNVDYFTIAVSLTFTVYLLTKENP